MSQASRMLMDDHWQLKHLFDEFEATDDERERDRIANEAMQLLEMHSAIEEEIVYPALRQTPEEGENLYQEALEEHHVIDMLIEELRELTASDVNFVAKFRVMAENVRHHIEVEEGEMLPYLEDSEDFDAEAMAEELESRKDELMSTVEAGTGRRLADTSRAGRRHTM